MSDEDEMITVEVDSGSHERIEDGDRVQYEPGETLEVTQSYYEAWERKLEPVGRQPEPRSTPEPTAASNTSSNDVSSSPDAEAETGEAGTTASEAESDEFLDRNVTSIRNAIDAGHADGSLQEYYEAEEASEDARVTVRRYLVHRMIENDVDVPDDWDVEEDEPK